MTDFNPEGISLRTLHESQTSLHKISEMLERVLTNQSLLPQNIAWDNAHDLEKEDTISVSKRYDLMGRGLHPAQMKLGNRTSVWNRFTHRRWMSLVEQGMKRGLGAEEAMRLAMKELDNKQAA